MVCLSQWTPVHHTWRLNERNYGGLQGLVKAECAERWGLKQVQRWRRGIHLGRFSLQLQLGRDRRGSRHGVGTCDL